jgi:hypothetical protein
MNAHQIRAWLLQQPRASSLRVTCGKEKSDVSVAGQSWAKLAATLEAMQADQIQALDVGGNVLRAVRPADVDEKDETPAEPEAATAVPASAYDPETVRFELVAKLLADAHKFSVGVAFEKIVMIVDAQNRRSESLERSLASAERLLRKQAEDLFDEANEKAAAGEGDLAKEMVNGFLQSAMGGGDKPAPNGKAKA